MCEKNIKCCGNKQLFITTYYQPKMIKRGLTPFIQKEISFEEFKETFFKLGGVYEISFILTSPSDMRDLLHIMGIKTNDNGGKLSGKSIIESEEVEECDIILLAAPTQSSQFRYFIIRQLI